MLKWPPNNRINRRETEGELECFLTFVEEIKISKDSPPGIRYKKISFIIERRKLSEVTGNHKSLVVVAVSVPLQFEPSSFVRFLIMFPNCKMYVSEPGEYKGGIDYKACYG